MKHFRITFILFTIVAFSAGNAFAQEAMEKFGKNRVQYKNFKWRYYSTENFDIYFYDGGNELAQIATEYLEKDFDRVTDMLGTISYSKTEIFLYNSPTDLLQSNIGVDDNNSTVSGQTDFVKPLVEIAYPGTAEEFKRILIYKLSSMLIRDMMFGGSLSDMFQNSFLLLLPEWYMSGASRYVAYGWDVEMDDYIRDIIRNKNIKNLNKFTGYDAELIGQSIWNFIAERYGTSYISNILNLTRIIRNEERSISGTIGIPYKSFLTQWENYYLEQTSFIDQNYTLPNKKDVVNSNKKEVELKDIKISPEGNYYAYTTNNKGKYKVVISEVGRKKERTVLTGGYKVLNQEPDENIPLLSWKDENTLGIIDTKYGKNYLWIYDLGSKKKVKKELTQISIVKDFDIVRNGNLAVLSAERNGDNDLYLISLKRNSIKRITSDFFDDINPRFVPGTSSIIFSSNRTTDTIDVKGRDIEAISDIYNVFIYNIDTTDKVVHRVTNTMSTNIKPMAVSPTEYFFISDQQGIFNLYTYDLSKKIYHQVTNYGTGIIDYDISYDKKYFGFVMPENGRDNLYLGENYNLDQNIFTAQTKRQQYLTAKFVAQRLKKVREEREEAAKTDKPRPENITKDSVVSVPQQQTVMSKPSFLDQYQDKDIVGSGEDLVDTKNYPFYVPIAAEPDKKEEKQQDSNDFLDTDNYVFDTDVVKTDKGISGSLLSSYRKFRKESDVAGPFPYEMKFSADNVVTSFVIDPLLGFGLNLEVQLNDQLENHKFYGGLLATTDLKSGNFYGEYKFLKYTVDFSAKYQRNAVYRQVIEGTGYQKYTLNTWEVGASLPFSVTSRLTVTPFFQTTHFWDLDQNAVLYPPPSGPVTSAYSYGGLQVEFVYDNTIVGGLNLIQGSRGKIGLRHNEGITDSQKSFSNFYMDLRHYQKLHRELVFATRLFYGRYWGANPQSYLLGGMDNWLFSNTNDTGLGNPLTQVQGVDDSNILFVDYVTSLRGFDFNTFNGENTLLFNAELRLPLIKYLYRGPIASNFLRNIQFIGFYDIGSAWTGSSPFATENSVNTEILAPPGSPFSAKIQNYKNPWLSSYGFGMRTVLLGYYVKFDIAYPIEDYVKQNTKYLLTLGYDF